MYVSCMDIYPSATACHLSQYKKTFLVGNIDLARLSKLLWVKSITLEMTLRLSSTAIKQQSSNFVSVGTTDYEISKRNPERLKMIAQDTGAQYIIGGVITDLTATIEQKLKEDI